MWQIKHIFLHIILYSHNKQKLFNYNQSRQKETNIIGSQRDVNHVQETNKIHLHIWIIFIFFKPMDVATVPVEGLFHICFQNKHIKEAGL